MSYTDSQPSVVRYLHRLREEELQRVAEQQRRRRELRRSRPQARRRVLRLRRVLGTLRTALRRRKVAAPRL